ncbi:TOTE conflict system archaeo-eukaryotic primase domain-containing protein [Rummeliibacillus suwonensis]|uniref:TOTE conflict system archaeo-eukaryotic primase domain-containing protein n=1 Tax=Rummeliibacillus suwonensis TaxID=1306154 RepID=UPI00289D8843|nr:DEAD/DEAH box helicase family protein [Rummeliibacillus suwonensis]
MVEFGHDYTLKNKKIAKVIRTVRNYFNNEELLEIEIDTEPYFVNIREFEANIEQQDTTPTSRTTEQKIKLYHSYFRGREDIVADSFKNSQTGKMVYYPYCLTRKRGNCPKLKNERFECSKCKVAKFRPVSDELIYEHFKGTRPYKNGEVLYGMYPILKDNTVYFLAIDFDKSEWWQKEVKAVFDTAAKFGLSPLIELSQSGNGAHLWFFFDSNIPAKKARQLGNYLLKQSMVDYPELSFDSFDRLFPNQDELSAGGFGNLIALPLQGNRVKRGTSRFIDEDMNLVSDIMGMLEKTPKLRESEVDALVSKMSIEFNFFRPQMIEIETEEINIFDVDQADDKNTDEIHIKLGNTISFNRKELSGEEQARLKTLSTFHNPEFYKKLKKRLPTKDIPRLISLAEFDEKRMEIPRGLLAEVKQEYPNAIIDDERTIGHRIEATFTGKLYPSQQLALNELKNHEIGILMADTGFGKTVLSAKLIADLGVSTLVLVNNKNLAQQWIDSLSNFLDIQSEPFEEFTKTGRKKKKSKIGKIFGGKDSRSGNIDIALFQSLSKRDGLSELLSDYGLVIVDEAHHVAAFTFENVLKQAKSKYIYGLTATPKREDGLENIEFLRMGPIRHKAEKEIPLHIDQKLYMRFTSLGEHNSLVEQNRIHENYELMIQSQDRNEQIVNDVVEAVKDNRHLIVLTRQIEHIDKLTELLEACGLTECLYVLNSSKKAKELKIELEKLKADNSPFVLLTTGSYAGEGFDLPMLDTLVLAMPYSGKTSMQQFLGRLLRNLDEKDELRVYDYVDYAIPMIYRMYQKRMLSYKKLGYEIVIDDKASLYKSDFYEESYEDTLLNDIKNSTKDITLILPFLSKSFTTNLESIKFDKAVHKLIIIPDVKYVSENYKEYMNLNISKLVATGFQVKYTKKFKQKFVVIDNQLSWMLPENPNDDSSNVAARMYSRTMASKLLTHFM